MRLVDGPLHSCWQWPQEHAVSNLARDNSAWWPHAGSVEASLNLTNPLGYAEQVSLGAEYGSQATNSCTFAVTKPKPMGYPVLLDARLHQLGHNHQAWSSFVELLRGGAITLSR